MGGAKAVLPVIRHDKNHMRRPIQANQQVHETISVPVHRGKVVNMVVCIIRQQNSFLKGGNTVVVVSDLLEPPYLAPRLNDTLSLWFS